MSGKHPWILLAALLALGAAATASCGGDGGGGNDGDADVIATPDGDATTTSSPDSRLDVSPTGRPYLLGARAEGYDITRSAFPRPASASCLAISRMGPAAARRMWNGALAWMSIMASNWASEVFWITESQA